MKNSDNGCMKFSNFSERLEIILFSGMYTSIFSLHQFGLHQIFFQIF